MPYLRGINSSHSGNQKQYFSCSFCHSSMRTLRFLRLGFHLVWGCPLCLLGLLCHRLAYHFSPVYLQAYSHCARVCCSLWNVGLGVSSRVKGPCHTVFSPQRWGLPLPLLCVGTFRYPRGPVFPYQRCQRYSTFRFDCMPLPR